MRDGIKMNYPAFFNYPKSAINELSSAVWKVHNNVVCIQDPFDLLLCIAFPYLDILNFIQPGIFPEVFYCHRVLINSDHMRFGKSFSNKDAKWPDACEHINNFIAIFYLICDPYPFS